MSLFEFFKGTQPLTEGIVEDVQKNLKLNEFMSQAIIFRDLPLEWTMKDIKENVKDVCK